MTRMRGAVLIAIAAALAFPFAARAQNPADDDSASLARVRERLAQPPSKLALKPVVPDFRLEIEERQRWEHFEALMWGTENEMRPNHPLPPSPSPYGTQPLVGVDLLAIGRSIAHAINESRREHAQRDASDEVRDAIAAYCAAQPNGGSDIQICTSVRR